MHRSYIISAKILFQHVMMVKHIQNKTTLILFNESGCFTYFNYQDKNLFKLKCIIQRIKQIYIPEITLVDSYKNFKKKT